MKEISMAVNLYLLGVFLVFGGSIVGLNGRESWKASLLAIFWPVVAAAMLAWVVALAPMRVFDYLVCRAVAVADAYRNQEEHVDDECQDR